MDQLQDDIVAQPGRIRRGRPGYWNGRYLQCHSFALASLSGNLSEDILSVVRLTSKNSEHRYP
jgi:hypothetical protein